MSIQWWKCKLHRVFVAKSVTTPSSRTLHLGDLYALKRISLPLYTSGSSCCRLSVAGRPYGHNGCRLHGKEIVDVAQHNAELEKKIHGV